MTVVVTVKINDGIVLASDSAVSFFDEKGLPIKIYSNANKIFNLVKGQPIGVMFWGAGGIGVASLSTIVKDLRQRLSSAQDNWKLPKDYSMEFVATRLRQFLFEERFAAAYGATPPKGYFLGCKVCGYSAGAELPEVWDVKIIEDKCDLPQLSQAQDVFGPSWDGEYEAMDRLILGIGSRTTEVLQEEGLSKEDAAAGVGKMVAKLRVGVVMAAMPIQDAIELATFMVETNIKFVRFTLMRAETVGGPIEVAAITKHEGFRWVNRKFFYTQELNP
jgi:20S proteasome alpha/beta subunit